MTDGELRGIVLEKFYELRHQQDIVSLRDITSIDPNQWTQIANICDQLAQHNLITWKPIKSMVGIFDGMGRITADGVDVMEGAAPAPIAIVLHDHSIAVSGSSHVQIGNSNVQGINLHIDKLIAAVDHSHASDIEKAEAKSLLEKLVSNPLVRAVWGAVFGGGTSS